MCTTITKFIDNEVSNGISCDRIVVAGFSMGGALSMYMSYKYKLSLAGCCAMSSFLNKNSLVYEVCMLKVTKLFSVILIYVMYFSYFLLPTYSI